MKNIFSADNLRILSEKISEECKMLKRTQIIVHAFVCVKVFPRCKHVW